MHVLMSRSILGTQEMVDVLKDKLKQHHNVAVLLFSAFDNQFKNSKEYHAFYAPGSEYYNKIVDSFKPYGIDEKNITWIFEDSDHQDTIIHQIEKADIIYFPGGAPDMMMKRIIQKGIKETLENHQKIYIGSSAGAMIQFKNYHISPDSEYPYFRYEEGLNLLKGFSIEVHYRRRKKQKAGMRKVFRAYRHPIFTIPDDGALIVLEDEFILVGTTDLMYDHKGIYR